MERAPGEIGDFGAIAKPVDEDEWEKVQMAELKHGRLAMLAVLGCFAQEMVTGEGPVEQLFTGNVSTKDENIEWVTRSGCFERLHTSEEGFI